MFAKTKDENEQVPSLVQQLQRPAATKSGQQESTDQTSSISRGTTVVGKIVGGAPCKYSAKLRASFVRRPFL